LQPGMITQLQLQLEVTDAEWVGQIGYRLQKHFNCNLSHSPITKVEQ
jgi:hypothetical protein